MNENHNYSKQKAEQRKSESDKTGSCRQSNRKWASQKGRKPKEAGGTYLLTSCGTEAVSVFYKLFSPPLHLKNLNNILKNTDKNKLKSVRLQQAARTALVCLAVCSTYP